MKNVARLAFAVTLLGLACDPDPEPDRLRSERAAIIGGTPDLTTDAATLIRHRDKASLCSGVAIAPDLVLTARHCVFLDGAPAREDGFVLGFGPDEERMHERFVADVEWVEGRGDGGEGGPSDDYVAAGLDVAVLWLTEPAVEGTALKNIDFEYTPHASDDLTLVGYGVSSLGTGAVGTRLQGAVTPSGFAPETGVLQVSGPSPCFGDSGGPLFLQPDGRVIGVLSEVGGSDAGFCDLGLGFAATVANPDVRAFVEEKCAMAGGCGPRATDAGVREASVEADVLVDAGPSVGRNDAAPRASRDAAWVAEGGVPSAAEQVRKHSGGGGCNLASRPPSGLSLKALGFLALVLAAFRRRTRSRSAPRWTLLLLGLVTACGGDEGHRSTAQIADGGPDATVSLDPGVPSQGHADAMANIDGALADAREPSHDAWSPLPDAASVGDPFDALPDAEPVSLFCGDSIRDSVLEECDDGPGDEDDGCTPDCRAREVFVTVPLAATDSGPVFGAARRLGSGPHVIATQRDGFAIVFQEADPSAQVWLQAFDDVGHRLGDAVLVSQGRAPTGEANPVVAAIASGVYGVAWTDGAGGTPDVVLRTVNVTTRTLGAVRTAHTSLAGAQQDPDIVRVGSEWVVAWTDFFEVHARRFGSTLSPIGQEESIPQAATALQSGVALATHADGWAMAWRATDGGPETIEVVSGGHAWTTEPHLPGPFGDRPSMAQLPNGKLAVVFSAETDAVDGGVTSPTELRAAVLDIAEEGIVTSSPVATGSPLASAYRPRVAPIEDRIGVVWGSEAPLPGGTSARIGALEGPWSGGDALVITEVTTLALDGSAADRGNPALAGAHGGAFVAAWEDWSLVPGRAVPDLGHVFRGFGVTLSADGG